MGGTQSTAEKRLGTLDVAVERLVYYPGDRVQAYVQIEVRRAVRCLGVAVDLTCKAETALDPGARDPREPEMREVLDVLRPDTIRIASECTFETGKYQFPFAFKLPLATPPTVEVRTPTGVLARTNFVMTVRFRAAKGARDQARRYRIRVLNQPLHVMRPLRVENRRVLSRWFCVPDGYVQCVLEVDHPAFRNGETIKANFVVTNKSNNTVSRLTMHTQVSIEVSITGKLFEYSASGPEHESTISVAPSSTARGSIAIPFRFAYPSVDAHTLKVFHHLVFRARFSRRSHAEITAPILAYGDHRDTTLPQQPAKSKSRRFRSGVSSRPKASVELEGSRTRNRSAPVARVDPEAGMVTAATVEHPGRVYSGVIDDPSYAEPIAFVPDAEVIESTTKEFKLARTPSATFE